MPIRLALMCAAALFCILSMAADRPPAAAPTAAAPKAGGVTIYDPDPQHLLNRLHRAMAVRTIDGVDYGTDNAIPFFINDADALVSGDAHVQLLSVLDEFLRTQTPDRLPGELPRALLQHEAWATFDHTLFRRTLDELPAQRKAMRTRLAKVIALLALKDSDIARLPDNYADAVKSGAFPRDFDAANPEKTFLPPDLFDSKGPWVEISDDHGRAVAPDHVRSLQGRSTFRIFLRLPGERKETLAYMQKVNLHTTPWALEPAMIGTTHLGNEVRWDPLRMDRKTPQFPEGTMIALVRQMIVINDKLQLRSTPITQSVQFRVFRSIGEGFGVSEPEQAKAQAFFELNLRRGGLLAGKAGGLHAVAKDDVEYQMFPVGQPTAQTTANHESRASRLRGSAGMTACTTCHSANGIFSVRTYSRGTNPQLFPAPRPDHSAEHSLSHKLERFDWGVLRGMLEADGLSAIRAAMAQAETPKEAPVKKDSPAPPVATKKEEKPLHFVEKPDMKPQLDARVPYKVEGELAKMDILVPSKAFIADSVLPGRIRFRELIDPRYLKKHGLTDRDLAYEILDHQGLNNYHVADDLRTVLFVVDSKGGGKELIVVRWVVYEGHLYISPEKATDAKTGIFKPWILRTKLIEGNQSAQPVASDKQSEKPPHFVEKPDMKPRLDTKLPYKVEGELTQEQLLVASKAFISDNRLPGRIRFRELLDPRYLKKHGLTDRDIAFELADTQRITILDVADDLRTVLCGIELKGGKQEAIVLRWVPYEGHLYLSPEKAPDAKTGIFQPWILRAKVN